MKESFFGGLVIKGWDNNPTYSRDVDIVPRSYYTLQFNQRGNLEYSFNERSFRTVSGSYAWVTHPNTRYHFRSPGESHRFHRYVSFAGPRCDEYVRRGLIPPADPSPIIRITNSTQFIGAFDTLQKSVSPNRGRLGTYRYESGEIFLEYNGANPHYAVHLLEGLLLQLHHQPAERPAGARTEGMQELMEDIRRYPEKTWDFKEEAQTFRLSVTHFRRLFSKCAGSPPERFVRNMRLERAAQVLRETGDTVESIAHAVGFHDVYHFSTSFKRSYAVSPVGYRKETFVGPIRGGDTRRSSQPYL